MIKKVPKDERPARVAEAMRMVRLEGLEPASRRSSPAASANASRSRARSSIAPVLLLDEPLGALDLKLRQEMQIELKSIQREVGSPSST